MSDLLFPFSERELVLIGMAEPTIIVGIVVFYTSVLEVETCLDITHTIIMKPPLIDP